MFVYGPVPSRRLGHSLGVDIIPRKTCSYSCVYCQLGRTKKCQIQLESFFPPESILKEIGVRLNSGQPDYLSFVGHGEPTLSSDLGRLIDVCKNRWPIPVAVITNGSLFYDPQVRRNLLQADVVLPSLDAANETVFQKINRPHPDLHLDKIIDGLIAFRQEYAGKIRLEIMLVENINDSEEHILELKKIVDIVKPDVVDISIPIRPPTEKWAKPPSLERIFFAQKIMGGTDVMTTSEQGSIGLANFQSVMEAVEQLSIRHPLNIGQAIAIERSFGQDGEIKKLVSQGLLRQEEFEGRLFIFPVDKDNLPG